MRLLHGSQSGQELAQEGHIRDVDIAAELDGSDRAPRLIDGAYRA
jgi:phosphosulfolactate phosphohydrolase-like enzyme